MKTNNYGLEQVAAAMFELVRLDREFAAEQRLYRSSPEYAAKVNAQRAAEAEAKAAELAHRRFPTAPNGATLMIKVGS